MVDKKQLNLALNDLGAILMVIFILAFIIVVSMSSLAHSPFMELTKRGLAR